MADLKKARKLLEEAMSCLEDYEAKDGEGKEPKHEPTPDIDDDMATKSMKMKLAKYK